MGRTASPPQKIPVADGPDALLPLSSFRNRSFALANVSAPAVGFVPVTVFAVLMLYFQQARGWSAAESGAAFLPVAAGMATGASLAGKLRRTCHLGILTAGLGITVAAIAGLAFVTQAAPFAALVPPLVRSAPGRG